MDRPGPCPDACEYCRHASRGGFGALLAAAALCLVLRKMRYHQLGFKLLPVLVPALLLLVWLGVDRLSSRLMSTWADGPDERLDAWGRVLPLAVDFPLWGLGYGTFPFAEQMRARASHTLKGSGTTHIMNTSSCVEGGVARLLLTVLAIGLVFRYGYRALRGLNVPGRPDWFWGPCSASPASSSTVSSILACTFQPLRCWGVCSRLPMRPGG